MVIKKKDGSFYKISGPNPLMNNQYLWKDYKKYNFDWLPEVVKDETFINVIKDQEVKPEEKQEEKEQEQKVIKQLAEKIIKSENIKKYNPIPCFCLPAKTTEKKDDLYDESFRRTEYLEKFTIEIIILDKDDLYIKIWCKDQLTEKSILYPRNKDKRWWKIIEVSSAPSGYYYLGSTSDYTPSFE
jgi:hypothetical protein